MSAKQKAHMRRMADAHSHSAQERHAATIRSGVCECRACRMVLPISEFRSDTSKPYPALIRKCIKCYDARKAECRTARYQSLENSLTIQFQNIKVRCRKRNWICDFDISFLVELWHKQGGLCCYTGQPMVFARVARTGEKQNNPDMVSVDRVDSSKGYTRSNVVLCRSLVNMMKLDMTATQFYAMIRQLHAHCCETFNR